MLHSTLPRAFLAPGLKYLSSYYGEEASYQAAAYPASSQFEEHYPRITEHHVFPTWHTVQRPTSPCPLDLSLKPSRDLQDGTRTREEHRGRGESRGYVLDVEEDDAAGRIVLRNGGEDDSVARDNARIGIYPEDEIGPASPGRDKIPGDSTPGVNLQGYHQHQVLMTPQHHLQGINAPMTPPSTPSPPQCPRKRQREDSRSSATSPSSNISTRQTGPVEKPPRPKKKHARRLKFDEDTSSPVSGTVILGPDEAVVTGDIDPAFNVVEVTEEARAELAKIENRLGPYQCRLCRQLHEDAFQLAQHRCSRIAHVEYRCPECDKRFSCPANLASHRRWHKPRAPAGENATPPVIGANGHPATNGGEFPCSRCDAKFGRQAALRKHLASQHPEAIGNGSNGSNGSNGRSSAGSSAGSSPSLVGNVDQVLNHVGNHLGVTPLSVEMP